MTNSEKVSNGFQAAAIFDYGSTRDLGLKMKYAVTNRA